MREFKGRVSELNILQREFDSDEFQMVVLSKRF